MAEAHQPERIILVLRTRDEFGDAVGRADLAQHVERGLVGAAMRRAPQSGDAGSDAGERIGTRGTGQTNGRGRRILLVIGVEDEDLVHRRFDHRIDFIVFCRHAEGHAQEIAGVGQAVVGEQEGLADRIFVGHRGERRHLRDQAVHRDGALARIVDVCRVRIESRECSDHAAHDRHRVRIATEAAEEGRQLLVHHRVARDRLGEGAELVRARQVAVQEEVGHLHERRFLGELVDRIAAVQQHAGIAVDIGQPAFAARGRGETRIVGENAGLAVELSDIDDVRAGGAGQYGGLEFLTGNADRALGHAAAPN